MGMSRLIQKRHLTLEGGYSYIHYYDHGGASAHEKYLESGGLSDAKHLIFFVVYYEREFTPKLTTQQRDQQVRERHSRSEAITALALEYGISPQRMHQIINTE